MRKILVTDDSSHWYLIDESDRQLFADWVEWMSGDDDRDFDGDGLDGCRINGPGSIVITAYEDA